MRLRCLGHIWASAAVGLLIALSSSCGTSGSELSGIVRSASKQNILAFGAEETGIFVAAPDGSGAKVVATTPDPIRSGYKSTVAPSPDGQAIAFTGPPAASDGGLSLYMVEVQSGVVRTISEHAVNGEYAASWSPDGRYLAYGVVGPMEGRPVASTELRLYERATGHDTRLRTPAFFQGTAIWTMDSSAVVYPVGEWQQRNSGRAGVSTYRARLDGLGGTPWRIGIRLVAPGPGGEWLGVREPSDQEGRSQSFIVRADGGDSPTNQPEAEASIPLGWSGADPIVWRKTGEATAPGGRRYAAGEVWSAGSPPRIVASGLPVMGVGTPRRAAVGAGFLLYADEDVWRVDFTTGERRHLAAGATGGLGVSGTP